LDPHESAWEFEVYGSVRSDCYDHFYASKEITVPVINGVIKGKWQRSAVRALRKLGFNPDLSRRPLMGLRETLLFKVKQVRSFLLQCCPSRYRRQIKDFVLRVPYSYASKF
jgi:hypothetical protein